MGLLRTTAAIGIALFGAALLIQRLTSSDRPAGQALQAPASASAVSSILPDARWYAEANGVSLEEANRRLQLQPAIAELGAALESKETATFAGLWIEHTPRYRVVAAFTRDGEATLGRYVSGSPLAKIVEVQRATFTLARLQQDIATVAAVLRGLPFTGGVNVRENRVDIQVGAREEADAFLRARGLQLPATVRLLYMGQGSLDCSDEGGRPYGVFFPRHCTQPWQPMMTALFEGVLIVRDGCLLAGNDLAVWPPGWSLAKAGDTLEVRDATGGRVGAVGEKVRLSGGQLSDPKHVTDRIGREPPADCRGLNAWVVGSAVRP